MPVYEPAAVDPREYTLPDGLFRESIPDGRFSRLDIASGSTLLTSGTLRVVAIGLIAGEVVTTIGTVSADAASSPTNQWACLLDRDLNVLAKSTDRTTEAWGATTYKGFDGGTFPFTVTTSGLYYLGLVVVATTPPTLRIATNTTGLTAIAPITVGNSTTGLTNPASLGATAAALTAISSPHWAAVG